MLSKSRKLSLVTGVTVLYLMLSATVKLEAGLMCHTVRPEIYRDFAENRGPFQAGARNIPIINQHTGELIGRVPHVPNFDAINDRGWAALIAKPGFVATVAHNNNTTISFARRFGAEAEPFHDSYDFTNYNRAEYDFAVPRLSKLVTEATPFNISFPASGKLDTTYLERIVEQHCVRVGAGAQRVATARKEAEKIAGAYRFLTGGTVDWVGPKAGKSAYTLKKDPVSFSLRFQSRAADEVSPLHIVGMSGDSGSAALTYNPQTKQFEYIGANSTGYGAAGYGKSGWVRGNPLFIVEVIKSYESIVKSAVGAPVDWEVNSDGTCRFTQAGRTVGNCHGLSSDIHGATSTSSAGGSSTAASPEQLNATNNLIFTGGSDTIRIKRPLDMGAGALTFYHDTRLIGARLNSAGFIIEAGVNVTSELTGHDGDEWRKVGPGTLIIAGNQSNPAKLNTGGGGLTVLNRVGGSAVAQVKINGGPNTTVRLDGTKQIGGANGSPDTVVFGHRGGTLDLYGQSTSWATITHLDHGATISNTKPQSTSTFTLTGSGEQTYLGGFSDGGSLAAGLLNVIYDGGKGSKLKLHGNIRHQGTSEFTSGTVEISGRPTPLAGGRFDKVNLLCASFNTGAATIHRGATVILAKGAQVSSDFHIKGGGTLVIHPSAGFTGKIFRENPAAILQVIEAGDE